MIDPILKPQPEAELPRHDSSSLDHTNIDQSSLDRGSRDPANPDNESRDDNLTHDPRSLDHLDPTQQHHQHHLQHNQSQQQSSVPPQTSLPLPHIASGQLTNQLLAGVPGCLAPGLQLNHSRSGASPELPLGNYANVPSVETSPSQTQDPRSPSITGRPPYDWMKKQAFQSQLSSDAESTEASGFKSGQKKTRTKDKYRIVYSEYQKIELEKEYLYSKYITIQRKSELSRSITLSERQVKIWFQNRRAKERKQKRKRDDVITPPDTPTKMPCMDGSSGIPHSEHMGEPPISMHLGESMIPPPLLQQQQHTQQPPHLGQVPPSSLHHHALSHQQQQMLPHPSVSLGALITQTPAMSILPHHVPLTPVTPSSNPSPAIKNEMIMQDVHCQSLRMPVH